MTTTSPKPSSSQDIPTPAALARKAEQSAPRPDASASVSPTYVKGDIWMVNADPQRETVGTEMWANRPGVIVSGHVTNNRAGFVQVVYLSTSAKKRSGPTHIEIKRPGHRDAMALCEQIHTVDISRLRYHMGTVPGFILKDIDAAIALNLSLGRNPDTYGLFHKWEEHIKHNGLDIQQEIQALAGQTTDERVEALTTALHLVSEERDAYRRLYEIHQAQPQVKSQLAKAQRSRHVRRERKRTIRHHQQQKSA